MSKHSLIDPDSQSARDQAYAEGMGDYFQRSPGTTLDRLRSFTKFVPRQSLAAFLAKNALFQQVLEVHGHIIECGVHLGGGLMGWANLSAIYEPYNHTRRIIGFDTFRGFPAVHDKDRAAKGPGAAPGDLACDTRADLEECIALYDLNRPLGHIERVELVEGDATETIPDFVERNPHLMVALLYLDFDIYEPTRAALQSLCKRMPKGAVIAFDELNQSRWPGETLALMETIGLRNVEVRRFTFVPQLSYVVVN